MGNILLVFILIWKNFKLQVRHPWITALQLLIPTLFMILLILLRRLSSIEKREVETIFDSYPIDTLPVEIYNSSEEIYLYYTPKSVFFDEIMSSIGTSLSVNVTGFDTEQDLEVFYKNSSTTVFAGIVFDPKLSNGIQEYGPITYTIRSENIPGIDWNLSYTMPSFSLFELKDKSLYGTYYMKYGFLTVQHAIAKALLEKLFQDWEGKFDDMFRLEMSRLPYPAYESDSFYKIPDYYIALAICFGFLFPIAMIAKNHVHERHTNLKKTLQMMGVSNWENWTAWFIKDFIFLFIISLIMTILLCTGFGGPAVLNRSSSSLILLWLILYSGSIIAFTYFISIFFDRDNAAVAGVCILYIITFLPYMHSRGLFNQVPYVAKLLLCIFPNTAFSYSVHVMLNLELLGRGLDSHTQHFSNYINVEFSMYIVNALLGFDILFYFILTWYAEVMRLGSFPNQHPWYFPFTAAYWTGMKDIPPEWSISNKHSHNEYFERDPLKVRPIIHIKNLTKVYNKRSKPVIDSIDLNAYKGQITVVLGHNCCGKSTFISMIYGATTPTAGSIIIRGFNMCKAEQKRNVIPFLGICPEYDIAINELTIKENLYFFCKVKGIDAAGIKSEVHHILGLFDLEIKKKRLVSTLSKTAKRLLSVGIALIGESEVVILDEPTLGMNSYSRRILWDALILEKESRSIFLTTSHVKEAFAIANRIAVLHDGHLKCCGSPIFLQKKYGMGYLLTLSKDSEYNAIRVKTVILKRIPSAEVISETENEHKFLLPPDKKDLYQYLFEDLEKTDLHIKNIFINEFTLEELFNKILDTSTSNISGDANKGHSIQFGEEESVCYSFPKEKNEGFALFSQHVKAIFRKKYLFSKRNVILTLSQIIILPLILALSNLMREAEVFENYSVASHSIFDLKAFEGIEVMYGIDGRTNLTIDLGDTYASLLDEIGVISHLVDLDEKNYLSQLIKKAGNDLKFYRLHYIIGATFEVDILNKTLITAFYNSEAYHSAPISLLYIHNTLLRLFSKEQSLSFNITHIPLPFKDKEHQSLFKTFKLNASFYWAQDLIIGLAFLMSSFVVLLVTEISSKSKKQQFISGLNAFTYWFSLFVYDYAIYLIPSIFVLIIISIFQTECLYDVQEIGFLAILLLLHGLSSLLFIYCWTLCCRSAPFAYISIFLYYLIGLFFVGVVYRLETVDLYHVSELLNIIFTVLMPSYCVGRGIYNLHRNCMSNNVCNNDKIQEMCVHKNITSFIMDSCCQDQCNERCLYWSLNHLSFSTPGIGLQVTALAVQPFIYILILILLEMEVIQNLKLYIEEKRTKYYETKSDTDKDVLKEEEVILSSPLPQLVDKNYFLILKNVSKFLPRLVVGKLSFGLKKAECFGLIGIDLCGKSTVLTMISGSTPLSSGNIYINGISMLNSPHKILDKIGFSFGRDALLDKLTVGETLRLYAQIRGIPEKNIDCFIKCLTETLKLYPHLLVKKCNNTDKGKLCVAVSVIGMPPLVLLEEPTLGLDPIACKNIHKVIKQSLIEGCTVFLTTQKLNECQALCNRIGILVSGKLEYIGALDHLRAKYKDGFTLILNMVKSRSSRSRHTRQAVAVKGGLDEVKGHIEIAYPEAVLKVEFSTYLNYYFPNREIKWSKLFRNLETMKIKDLIISYSICETFLDQILLYHVNSVDFYKEKKIADFLKERKRAEI